MKQPAEESSKLEFKKTIPENAQIIKTIIGFCNQKGGKLIIGIDSNATIVGLSNDDVQKVADSLLLLDDKIYRDIYKMTATEIYHTIGSAELIMSMIGLKMAAQANDTTLHHFSCEWPIHGAEKFFEGYVERANKFDKELKGLKDAEIRGA